MKRIQSIVKTRQSLVRRRDALRQSLAGELGLIKSLAGQSTGDEIDRALDTEQGEVNSQLIEVESRELEKIEYALQRIDSGHFGRCEACDGKIPLARLQAVPYATLCVSCQRLAERGSPTNRIHGDWSRIVERDPDASTISFKDIESFVF